LGGGLSELLPWQPIFVQPPSKEIASLPRTIGKVLILSPHVMTAALVGWYVELARLEPAFAGPGEHPADTLARVKPLLVVLIDALDEAALSDIFAARVARREVGLAIFSGTPDDLAAREWARRHDAPFFTLPVDLEAFGRVLDHAARLAGGDRRVVDRRRQPAVDRAVDGTLRLVDAGGRAWYVYDRRGSERRSGGNYRAFVNLEGVELRATLTDAELSAREPDVLAAQLARAQAVGA
jgi:hypothetical protein